MGVVYIFTALYLCAHIHNLTNINGLISLCEWRNHPVIFSGRSVRSTRRNPTLCASPWSSMACVRRLFWLKHWWQMMVALPFQCLYVFPKRFLFLEIHGKGGRSIEVRLNVPSISPSRCRRIGYWIRVQNHVHFDLLKLYQECWCRQKHTLFILTFLPPRCFSHFWILLRFPL